MLLYIFYLIPLYHVITCSIENSVFFVIFEEAVPEWFECVNLKIKHDSLARIGPCRGTRTIFHFQFEVVSGCSVDGVLEVLLNVCVSFSATCFTVSFRSRDADIHGAHTDPIAHNLICCAVYTLFPSFANFGCRCRSSFFTNKLHRVQCKIQDVSVQRVIFV